LNQLWGEVCDLVGVTLEARRAEPRPGDVRDSLASAERAGALLGYEPSVDLREGLRRTIASLRKTREPERR
jgi:nucleoside-diphosphate-sugar epimerase